MTTATDELLPAEPTATGPAEPSSSTSGPAHAPATPPRAAGPDADGPDETAADDAMPTPPARMVAAAAATASLGAAWPLAHLFEPWHVAFLLCAVGIAVGAGTMYLAHRGDGGGMLGLLPIPVAAVLGALAVAPSAGGGTANLPGLVREAITAGGLEHAPVPLDPGWRFILIVLCAALAAASVSLAIGSVRSRLAVALSLPVLLGAGMLQPEGSEIVAGAVAMAFVIGGLAIAYGADLAAEGATGGAFELRRLANGAVMLALVMGALVLLAQTGVLFPASSQDQVVPPRKPPASPPEEDRELFVADGEQAGPLRVGVLDVYGQDALLLPPMDPARLVPVIGGAIGDAAGRPTYTLTITVSDMRGHTLPLPAETVRIDRDGDDRDGADRDGDLTLDPRIGTVTLAERVPQGFRYEVTAVASPDGRALGAALPADPVRFAEFLDLPPAPPGVGALLAKAPPDNLFERLQFVRQALYSQVIAAGAGQPVDILPARVDELLAGAEATPYEISAAEVMLARWAGIPSRLGFGYQGGDPVEGGRSFRPRDGAAWLEAYFEGHGWVPILGTPPRAKLSLSSEDKREDLRVQATDTLALTVFVPVRYEGLGLVYEIVRYWTLVIAATAAAIAALLAAIPIALKQVRRARRRRWALRAGLKPRLLVAYAELRDRMHDLNVGDPRDTPLEFLDAVEDDAEHEELAWLVTRGLWGDLTRDLREDDVEIAELMARSVGKRIVSEQSGINRAIAAVTRASLRAPWSDEIPNLWRSRTRRVAATRGGLLRRLRPAIAALLGVLLLGACAKPGNPPATTVADYPERDIPRAVLGYTIRREPTAEREYDAVDQDASLVDEGRVYTILDGETVQGSYQIAVLKDAYRTQDLELQADLEHSLSPRVFTTQRLGLVRLRVSRLDDQSVFAWFPPDRNVMQVFVMRKKFRDGERVVEAVIRHQLGFQENVR